MIRTIVEAGVVLLLATTLFLSGCADPQRTQDLVDAAGTAALIIVGTLR